MVLQAIHRVSSDLLATLEVRYIKYSEQSGVVFLGISKRKMTELLADMAEVGRPVIRNSAGAIVIDNCIIEEV